MAQQKGQKPNEAQLCECGCGKPTTIATKTCLSTGRVKGQPCRFLKGHRHRIKQGNATYVEEDRGHETPCWVWQGAKQNQGYGVVRHEGRAQLAHRVFYLRETGLAPRVLDHLCRVRLCVNPRHLEPVTTQENIQRGEAAKLNAEKVHELRILRSRGWPVKLLAHRYAITTQNVYDIAQGRTWANVA